MVPLKNLSNFWRTLEMLSINCEINIILAWSEKCLLSTNIKETTFAITDTKFYVPVVTLSIQDNTKLLEQLKSGSKRTINWNQYQSEPTIKAQNQYLNRLIDASFHGVNRVFVLSFENKDDRAVLTKYYLPNVEIKVYNITIVEKNIFGQLVKNSLITYENIRRIATSQ